MKKKDNEKKTQEFHFGDWTSSSDNDSQEAYDSDTICPISLNDLINIEKKSQKKNQDDDTDFVIPSLADSINNNNNSQFDNQEDTLKNKDNLFNTSVSKILYDFTQNATVLGFDSSISNRSDENEEEKNCYTTQHINKNDDKIDDNDEGDEGDEKLKSFTSLVQSEQTFVKLHQKCFSSSSDSDILVVTNNEEILEPDSDSSIENTFEDYQLSQIKQARSEIYESKEKQNINKSLAISNLNKIKAQKSAEIRKKEIKSQNLPIMKNEKEHQISKIESPQMKKQNNYNENDINKKSLNKSSKIFKSSPQKRITIKLTSSESSSSINLDYDNDNDDQNKHKNINKKTSPNRNISNALVNRKRHLNTLNKFSLNDYSYSSASAYSYSDEDNQKEELSSNYIDSLDSTITMKNTAKSRENVTQTINNNQIQQKFEKNQEKPDKLIQNNPTQQQKQYKIESQQKEPVNDKNLEKSNKHIQNDKNQAQEQQQQYKIEIQQKEPVNDKNLEKLNKHIQNDQNQIETKNDKIQTQEQHQIHKTENIQKEQKNGKSQEQASNHNQMHQNSENGQREERKSTSNQSKNRPAHSPSKGSSPSRIINLQQVEFDDTIVYPKPKKKSANSEVKNSRQKSSESSITDLPGVYPTIPPIILSPDRPKENSKINDQQLNASSEKLDQIELKSENQTKDEHSLDLTSLNESSKNSMYEIESPLKNSIHEIESPLKNSMHEIETPVKKSFDNRKSGNSSVLKKASFSNKKNKSHLADFDEKSSESDKWIDDDPCNPSDLIENANSNESIVEQKETEKEKIEKNQILSIDSKNLKEKPEINSISNSIDFDAPEKIEQNLSNKKIFDMSQINVPVFSFFEFISELPSFNDIDFISLVISINGLFNLPPPSGVSQLDLVLHFQNIRCTPIVLNLKSARFRAGKYDAIDSQVLIRIPLYSPDFLHKSFFCTENSATIGNIEELYRRKKSENGSENNSKSSLIEINGFNSNKLVLTFELMGNGKRICGSNLCLIEKAENDGNMKVTSLGKHFLRLMQRPNMKCELKKGEKEPLIEVQLNKVDDRDEKQMKSLPFFSLIHVFFVDSVVAYRQVLEQYRLKKANDLIDQKEFNLLSFFAAAAADLGSMKKFAKSFKDAMKKMPKDKRGDEDKLKLFVDILRGSVFQDLTNAKSKNNQKGLLPFSTVQISDLNS